MADIAQLILADHGRMRTLLADVETALGLPADTDSSAELLRRWETFAALVEVHADAAEEIGYPALFGPARTVARDSARATHDDIRETVCETRLYGPGSRPWRLVASAACAAVATHVHDLESGALARFPAQGIYADPASSRPPVDGLRHRPRGRRQTLRCDVK